MNQTKEQMQMKAWKISTTVGWALCLLIVLLSLNQLRYLFEPGPAAPAATNTITVSGTGDVVAIPDIATFSFGVTETATTVSAAQTSASTKTNAVIKALTDAGVATADIQTLSYNINPHYTYTNQPCVYNNVGNASGSVSGGAPSVAVSNGAVSSTIMIPVCPGQKSTLTGYDVSETIQVKVRDITKAGALFQTVGTLGVENVNDLQFSIDKIETVQDQARSLAITDARANAVKLAGELGVHLVRITSFSDNSGGGIVPFMYASNALAAPTSAAAPAPVIPQGEKKVTDNVSVTYEIQ